MTTNVAEEIPYHISLIWYRIFSATLFGYANIIETLCTIEITNIVRTQLLSVNLSGVGAKQPSAKEAPLHRAGIVHSLVHNREAVWKVPPAMEEGGGRRKEGGGRGGEDTRVKRNFPKVHV